MGVGILGMGENALACFVGRCTMLMRAVFVRYNKGKPFFILLLPKVSSVRVDLANAVANAGTEIRSTVHILTLQDMVLEVAVVAAEFEGDVVVLHRSVRSVHVPGATSFDVVN